jgi:uncharacterized protein YcbX
MWTLVGLFRYPLKSAQGESLEVADVEPGGLRGDRTWACLDDVDGTVGSAKHPQRWGRLLRIGTNLRDQTGKPALMLHVGGRTVLAGTADADAALSSFLNRPVHLSRDVPSDASLYRQLPDDVGMVPEWMDGVRPGQEIVTPLAGAQVGGRFVDFAAVHVVTTGALSTLSREVARTGVSAARFRPNLVIDAARDPEPGQVLHVGDVVLRVITQTPRCIIPALGDESPQRVDRPLLTALAQHHRVGVTGLGRASCFGTYAEVLQPGRLQLGQRAR